MTKIFLFGFALLLSAFARAQPAKAVYVELGGPGVASFNYDMRLTNRDDGIGGRVGIGGLRIEDVTAIFVPVGANYLLGKNHRDYFEIGAGVTLVSFRDRYRFNNDNVFRSRFGHLVFGYRLQPANGGFLFKASIVPIFGEGFFLPYYAGIAFGYTF